MAKPSTILRLAFGILLVMVGPVSAWAESVRIRANRVNLRAGPSTSTEVVATASRGEEFAVIGSRGRWLRIETRRGNSAWIREDLVTSSNKPRRTRKALPRSRNRQTAVTQEYLETKADESFGWLKIIGGVGAVLLGLLMLAAGSEVSRGSDTVGGAMTLLGLVGLGGGGALIYWGYSDLQEIHPDDRYLSHSRETSWTVGLGIRFEF